MSLLILSASLNPASLSRAMAQTARDTLTSDGTPCAWLDLRELTLPQCDGKVSYGHPSVNVARAAVSAASGILVATPIYNYDVNSALKNFVELTGKAWEGQTVGFLCAAGGASSYMGVMAMAQSLMLDFRCVIVPRFVYATSASFNDGKLVDEVLAARVVQCARATRDLAAAVKPLAL